MNTPLESPVRKAIQRILGPIVRLLIHHGFPLSWLTEEVKQAYVREAIGSLTATGENTPDSRITLMTGVHRRDVKRIRTEGHKPSRSIPPLVILLGLWKGHWADDAGVPRTLPRVTPTEDNPTTFFDLATRATGGNIAAATFLSECITRGVVTLDEETDTVRYLHQSDIPLNDITGVLEFFATHNGDHMDVSVTNLLTQDAPPYFDRALIYENLALEDAEAVETIARDKAQALIRELEIEIRRRAESGRTGDCQVTFGSFFLNRVSPALDDPTDPPPDPPAN